MNLQLHQKSFSMNKDIYSPEIDLYEFKEQVVELRKYTKEFSILIVEDYLVLQQSLKKIFTPLFKDVEVASDGVEGLKLYNDKVLKGEKYEIVLSDIAMPNMNGVEMTKQIREMDEEQIIFIFSAHQDSKYLLELINLDIRRFLEKPISLKHLFHELLLVCKSVYSKKDFSNKIVMRSNIYYYKNERELFIDEKPIKLSVYERLILELLLSKTNSAISNIEIINHLYFNGADVELDNVRKIVYKLRKKLSNELVENVHSIGYRIKI